jgi:hypothetical protein
LVVLSFLIGDAAAQESGTGCSSGLAEGLAAVEAVPTERRVPPALQALGKGCQTQLGPLAGAALQASTLDRERRAQVLAQAAAPELPSECRVRAPGEPALLLASRCPPPLGEEIAPGLLGDLDSGIYLFYLAAYHRLNEASSLDFRVLRILDYLLLAGALEGESTR